MYQSPCKCRHSWAYFKRIGIPSTQCSDAVSFSRVQEAYKDGRGARNMQQATCEITMKHAKSELGSMLLQASWHGTCSPDGKLGFICLTIQSLAASARAEAREGRGLSQSVAHKCTNACKILQASNEAAKGNQFLLHSSHYI